jgi:hypothetical protein
MIVLNTCAECGHSAKVSVNFTPAKDRGWYCAHDPYGDDLKESRVPCVKGKLPKRPKWCPIGKGGK